MKTIAVMGTFDTKKESLIYLIESFRELGFNTLSIGLGMKDVEDSELDITSEQVAEAGGANLADVRCYDRAKALYVMRKGAAKKVTEMWLGGKIDAIITLGGSQGTYMACEALKNLPIGFPKLVISTVAGHSGLGNIFDGMKDAFMVNPVVDIAGNNSILKGVLDEAIAALSQMVMTAQNERNHETGKTRIAITMWGVTTCCVEELQKILESRGYEVIVFHANGMGGKAMEDMIRDGQIHGVVDITMAELGNTLCDGNSPPVPDRLKAAAEMAIPDLVSAGGLDMISMHPPFDALPEKYRDRKKYYHEENVLFVRSNCEENALFGKVIAERLNNSHGNAKVIFPLQGISANDKPGSEFYDQEADEALFASLKNNLNQKVELIPMDMHINDAGFAAAAADLMIEMIKQSKEGKE